MMNSSNPLVTLKHRAREDRSTNTNKTPEPSDLTLRVPNKEILRFSDYSKKMNNSTFKDELRTQLNMKDKRNTS